MDQVLGSFALGTTGRAKAMDVRTAAHVGLLVGDVIRTERTGYKLGNRGLNRGLTGGLSILSEDTGQAGNSNRMECED
jgi:hypothetical protein